MSVREVKLSLWGSKSGYTLMEMNGSIFKHIRQGFAEPTFIVIRAPFEDIEPGEIIMDLRVCGSDWWVHMEDKRVIAELPHIVVPFRIPKNVTVWVDNARYIFAGFDGNNRIEGTCKTQLLFGDEFGGWGS